MPAKRPNASRILVAIAVSILLAASASTANEWDIDKDFVAI
jgi:hypothetical protein